MKILGYSERGIINSLIFSIGEDKTLMDAFISLINIPEIEKLKGTAKDYTILLEQSFSRFGDADLVIIIHYENPEDNKVLFIEGKVKTYQRKLWSLEKQFEKFEVADRYDGYSSNLFFQLHLKKLMFENLSEIITNGGIDELRYSDYRKMGDNPIVKKAFEKLIDCKEAHYIGLIPSTEAEIEIFKEGDETENYYLSWKKVHKFCQEHKLKKVLEIFEYNEGQVY